MLQAALHRRCAELQPFDQDLLERLDLRLAIQADHVEIDAVAALHVGRSEQVLHHFVRIDAIAARDQHEAHRVFVIGFVAQVFEHRQLLRAHLVRDLLDDLFPGDLVGQRGDDDVAVFYDVHAAAAHRAVAGRVHRLELVFRRDDLGSGREVRAFDVPAKLGDARLGLVEQADAGGRDFAQVVRRNIGGHAHGDSGRAVQQHVRYARWQPRGFLQRAVEVRRPVHRALAELFEQKSGDRREARLGIAHRGERFRIVRRAEVALAVDQRITVRERLRHQHHRLVAGAVAVRMELADDIADRARRFLRLGAGVEAEFAHRIDDAPLHRLEAVADEGQGAVEHDVHRIVEVGALGVILERNLFVVGLQVHFRREFKQKAPPGGGAVRQLCQCHVRRS